MAIVCFDNFADHSARLFTAQELSAWMIKTLVHEEMVDIVLETVQPVGKDLYF
ncbi:thiamine biosynthesis protein ThiJ [Paenibacillus sp. CAU 1523]|uniref:Thiamine biosynthesis protein ThiJ n=1 Tax=Paenibacillus arenosi TaxID=2774142 RepID=A0ABR9B2D0_9BACL|nr:thiamine biosynthesis protein ThiJ [Paenibacillus arenosi]